MTPHDINRTLAEFINKDDDIYFAPDRDRHDLAEVLAKLTAEQMDHLHVVLTGLFDEARTSAGLHHNVREMWSWLLTCDPSIIAQAVAEVVK